MNNIISNHFNLTKNEDKILNLIADKGVVNTTSITRGTGIARPNAYDVLNKLIEKGLITKFKQNMETLYKCNPLDSESIILQKNEELELLREELKHFNEKIAQKKNKFYDVEVFSGKKGFSNFIFSILENKDIFVFGAEGIFENKFPHLFVQWIKKVEKDKIKLNAIYNENYRIKRDSKKYHFIISRFTQRNLASKTTTIITKNSVSLVHWQEIPLIIHIKDRNIALDYKNEFMKLWNIAEK